MIWYYLQKICPAHMGTPAMLAQHAPPTQPGPIEINPGQEKSVMDPRQPTSKGHCTQPPPWPSHPHSSQPHSFTDNWPRTFTVLLLFQLSERLYWQPLLVMSSSTCSYNLDSRITLIVHTDRNGSCWYLSSLANVHIKHEYNTSSRDSPESHHHW